MMTSTWKTYPLCSRCRSTITQINRSIGRGKELSATAFEWCQTRNEILEDEAEILKDFYPDERYEPDFFTTYVDTELMDESIFDHEGGFLSSIGFSGETEEYELKVAALNWMDEFCSESV